MLGDLIGRKICPLDGFACTSVSRPYIECPIIRGHRRSGRERNRANTIDNRPNELVHQYLLQWLLPILLSLQQLGALC